VDVIEIIGDGGGGTRIHLFSGEDVYLVGHWLSLKYLYLFFPLLNVISEILRCFQLLCRFRLPFENKAEQLLLLVRFHLQIKIKYSQFDYTLPRSKACLAVGKPTVVANSFHLITLI
jgi:hypothetical protein